MTAAAYKTSSDLAKAQDAFSEFEKNQEAMLAVIARHRREASYNLEVKVKKSSPLHERAQKVWLEALKGGEHHGYRNAQVTVLAPTGTIGLLMDCDTLGIEPDFSLMKTKSLVGGTQMTLVNQSVERSLISLGYSLGDIASIVSHIKKTGGVEGAIAIKKEDLAIFDCAQPPSDKSSRFISPEGHLRIMASAQPFLSGAISKTVNLPESTMAKEIEKLYLEAWRLGLKSIAVYRDKSKVSQPLEVCYNCGT